MEATDELMGSRTGRRPEQQTSSTEADGAEDLPALFPRPPESIDRDTRWHPKGEAKEIEDIVMMEMPLAEFEIRQHIRGDPSGLRILTLYDCDPITHSRINDTNSFSHPKEPLLRRQGAEEAHRTRDLCRPSETSTLPDD